MKKLFLIIKLLFIINFSLIHSVIASKMEIIEDVKLQPSIKSNLEEFCIFDVGQGNSQLIIYKDARLGFLYDCGTASKQKHPKLQSLKSEDWNVFLTKEVITGKKLKGISIEEKEDIEEDIENQFSPGSESKSISNKDSDEIEKLSKSIKSVIQGASLEWLIIFLSHPDKDHISLVNEDTIPAGLKTLAFLGGDFLGKKGDSKEDEDSKEDNEKKKDSKTIQKVFNFLKKRDKTWVEMPFYWNWSYDGYPKTYQDIKNSFLGFDNIDPIIQETVRNLSLSQYNPEDFFHGSCWDLLVKIMTKNKNFKDFIDFNEYFPLSISEHSLATQNRKNILKTQVLIWSMNHRLYDVNAQSTVVSFKLPENDIRLICTGDAEESTFWRIKEELRKRSIVIPPKGEKRENILVIPHHGSKKNISKYMIDLFSPTVFIISAGNGKQYGHPHLGTIEWLREQIGKTQFISKYQKPKLIAFDKIKMGKNKIKKAYLKNSIREVGCPILCTNVLGTIKFTESSFNSLFKSFFDLEGSTYRVDFSKRAEVDINDLEQVEGDEDSCFYKKGEQYYYQVYNEEDLFYSMIEVEHNMIEEVNDEMEF